MTLHEQRGQFIRHSNAYAETRSEESLAELQSMAADSEFKVIRDAATRFLKNPPQRQRVVASPAGSPNFLEP